jgi:hypothetical protein
MAKITSQDNQWFRIMMQRLDQVGRFIELGDDDILAIIIQKLCNPEDMSLVKSLLKHNYECGARQISRLLERQEIVTSLLAHGNEDLFTFLVTEWFIEHSQNFLFLLTKAQQSVLLQKVIQDKKAVELVKHGSEESLKYAAEKLQLKTFEILLAYSPVDGWNAFISGIDDSKMFDILYNSVECPEIFSRLIQIVPHDRIRQDLESIGTRTLLHNICQGGSGLIYGIYMTKLESISQTVNLILKNINAKTEDDCSTPLHCAAILNRDGSIVTLSTVCST